MLVLSRLKGQTLVIGDDITIKIINATGKVRLSIDAPRCVPVDRLELRQKKEQNKRH